MNNFVDNLQDVFRLFGPIDIKRMFGGHGLSREGLMFGLVSDDIVYLKADAVNKGYFEELGLPRFEYIRKGQVATLSYFQAPEEIMDDSAEAAIWARRSFDAALRGDARARSRKE